MAPQQMSPIERQSFILTHSLLTKTTKAGDDQICLYPSKKCTNLRAKKKNGELHTMCEYHRIRANENQRRLERRRKAALRFPNRHAPKPKLWNRGFPEPLPLPLPLSFPLPEPKALLPAKRLELWQPIEIEILMACLFDTGETPCSPYQYHWPVLGSPTAHTFNPFTPQAKTLHVAQFV